MEISISIDTYSCIATEFPQTTAEAIAFIPKDQDADIPS